MVSAVGHRINLSSGVSQIECDSHDICFVGAVFFIVCDCVIKRCAR
jgi:hypothetical protein